MIGPLGNDQHDMLGPWWGVGRDSDAVSLFNGIKAQDPNTTFTQGCTIEDKDPPDNTPAGECGSVDARRRHRRGGLGRPGRARARRDAACMSGEAASRASIDLPGDQQAMLESLVATGKPVVLVVMVFGRPLAIPSWAADHVPRHRAGLVPRQRKVGHALADVLFGDVNPSCELPVTVPRATGQVPIYYNHLFHRPPARSRRSTKTRRYIDVPIACPALSVRLRPVVHEVRVRIRTFAWSATNVIWLCPRDGARQQTGTRAGEEIVQLYIGDPVASVSRPVRRLRGFERVTLEPGQDKTVTVHPGR